MKLNPTAVNGMVIDKYIYYAFFCLTVLAIWGSYFIINSLRKRETSKYESWMCVIFAALIGPAPFLIMNEILQAEWVNNVMEFSKMHFM